MNLIHLLRTLSINKEWKETKEITQKKRMMMLIPYDEIINRKRPMYWIVFGRFHRLFSLLHPRRLFNRLVRYPYQKLTRGFSDADAWNASHVLPKQIAGILRWYIKNSNGVSYPYYTYDEDVNKAALLRDIEFENYAVMFDEFAENGVAHNKKWQERCGGLSQQEYKKMMKWFTENFPGLWD